ncbi:MAG: hypothetical protein ACRDZP_07725 [Acidimicrobiales bacterium]
MLVVVGEVVDEGTEVVDEDEELAVDVVVVVVGLVVVVVVFGVVVVVVVVVLPNVDGTPRLVGERETFAPRRKPSKTAFFPSDAAGIGERTGSIVTTPLPSVVKACAGFVLAGR